MFDIAERDDWTTIPQQVSMKIDLYCDSACEVNREQPDSYEISHSGGSLRAGYPSRLGVCETQQL